MPNDMWSYRWYILRAVIASPLLVLCAIVPPLKTQYKERISRFIWP